MPRFDLQTLQFAEPAYLRLLVAPAILLALWGWRAARRRADARRYARHRVVPVRERYTLVGDLAFWLCLILATALAIVALARPQARVAAVRRAVIDIVILQDGSASMYVSDVKPDRWQRSIVFLRALAEALTWKGDRVALALFAHVAAPQLRLTKDPNALFFFLDHLGARSPFRLEDVTTWDTNIEEGIYWGLKLVDKDAELYGAEKNSKAFLVISDGQAWSGHVENALRTARDRRIPVFVAGVGTPGGGLIPEPVKAGALPPAETLRASLDRDALRAIAWAGGGDYFEIGREPDRDLAFRIVDAIRRRADRGPIEERFDDLYWPFLFAAAVLLCLGTFVLKERAELWWQAAGAVAAVMWLLR